MADPHLREAAESLLQSLGNQPYRSYAHYQSVNIVADELVAGHRPHGAMSSVRRFFCLFVTFDLLFTSLMWLICVMMKGDTLIEIYNREIIHFNIKISLFDVVMLAVARFILLIMFYGLLYINNWSVIALSTAGSCAFLIAKVFVYDWPNASQPVYQVFLIVCSFVVSWGEAWFLDFRVIPQELQVKRILDSIVTQGGVSERTPLLRAGVEAGVPRDDRDAASSKWFSPLDTPESSPRPSRQLILTQDQIDEYKAKAAESLTSAWKIINLPQWKMEKRGSQKGDVVESTDTEFGKVYRFTGMVDCPAHFLFQEFKDNLTRLPEWNPTILKSELIKQIDDGTDLSYQVTAGGGRGIIAPRDFVILRRTATLARDGSVISGATGGAASGAGDAHGYISCGVSVSVPGYPATGNYVRGNNKVGCWYLRPKAVSLAGGRVEEHTVFQWLMCCDLKGKIPQFILDAAFATVMLDYIKFVRKFAADSKAQGKF